MTEKKRKRLTNCEFWEKYGEQFARTEPHYEEARSGGRAKQPSASPARHDATKKTSRS